MSDICFCIFDLRMENSVVILSKR